MMLRIEIYLWKLFLSGAVDTIMFLVCNSLLITSNTDVFRTEVSYNLRSDQHQGKPIFS
jgi:hypothetical protein